MTKAEKDRYLIREFRDASYAIKQAFARLDPAAAGEHFYQLEVAAAANRIYNRRTRERARAHAHALATAWGL
jgi:hypothetical protein